MGKAAQNIVGKTADHNMLYADLTSVTTHDCRQARRRPAGLKLKAMRHAVKGSRFMRLRGRKLRWPILSAVGGLVLLIGSVLISQLSLRLADGRAPQGGPDHARSAVEMPGAASLQALLLAQAGESQRAAYAEMDRFENPEGSLPEAKGAAAGPAAENTALPQQAAAALSPTERLVKLIGSKAAEAPRLAEIILQQSERSGFDPLLVAAMISRESSFRAEAVSRKGAVGLLQVNPAHGEKMAALSNKPWRGKGALTDPEYNLELTLNYLAFLRGLMSDPKNLDQLLNAQHMSPEKIVSADRKLAAPVKPSDHSRGVLRLYTQWSSR